MPSMERTMPQLRTEGFFGRVSDEHKSSLNGLGEIASYLGVSISTARRMIKERGLPAALWGGPSAPYITTKTLVDRWVMIGHLQRSLGLPKAA